MLEPLKFLESLLREGALLRPRPLESRPVKRAAILESFLSILLLIVSYVTLCCCGLMLFDVVVVVGTWLFVVVESNCLLLLWWVPSCLLLY